MTEINNTVVFIVADESKNAGERDYMKSISALLTGKEKPNTDYFVFKVKGLQSPLAENNKNITGDPTVLPLDDIQYASVPVINDACFFMLTKNTDNLQIIGVGNATLQTVVDLQNLFHEHINDDATVSASYITHMVDGAAALEKIEKSGINLFAPIKMEDLVQIDFEKAGNVNFHPLDAVPHTNSAASCMIELEKFAQTENGQAMQRIVESGEKFAVVVINAGFGVGEPKQHVPYTQTEAEDHGFMLGALLPPGTHLLAMHGGPRNLIDENEHGQKNMAAFTTAYLQAQTQHQNPAPQVLCETFAKGLSYNSIKAGYMLAKLPNCRAFISNSEGYGTMDGAALHLDNNSMLLGMFPFAAHYADVTRQRQGNIERYNQAGIALIHMDGTELKVSHALDEQKTPYATRDAAKQIVTTLGLAKPDQPAQTMKPQGLKL